MTTVFLHQKDESLSQIEVDPDTTVEALAIECLDEKALVWLQDSDSPLDPKLTWVEVELVEWCHLHISVCAEVKVLVRFDGETKDFEFPPSTTVGRILEWVVGPEGFKLSDDQRAKHVLALAGHKDELPGDEHIGTEVDDRCAVLLDLRPGHRDAG